MKRTIRFLTMLCAAWGSLASCFAQPAAPANDNTHWWRDERFGRPFRNSETNQLPLIRVQKNRFVGPDGQPILFRGVSISDPDKIEREGHWNRHHFEKIKEMGATLVRIPVHPVSWRKRGPENYFKLLDQAVGWCAELGIHIDMDWHSIGNLKMELFQDPMYDTSQKETFEFWRAMARHYQGNHTIAFYELFNEPTLYRGELGRMSWSEWRKLNEDMISLIRAYDPEKIPLVAGFDWAYDLTPLLIEPIQAEGIGYVTHPYANKRSKPWEGKWQEDFGFAADQYPIIATEIGFEMRDAAPLKDEDYGNAIINFLEGKGISWVAWVYDPEWTPSLLKSWDNYELTGAGEFFKDAMQRKAAKKSGEAAGVK
jgi:hypothetical protein